MTIPVYVVVGLLSVMVVLLFGTVVELHRQILQLRLSVGLDDRTQSIDFNSEVVWDDLPIPSANGDTGTEGRSAVLMLSDSCTTCIEVGNRLASGSHHSLTAIVHARSLADATQWLETRGLKHGPQLVYDEDGQIADLLGVHTTPSVIKFQNSRPISAVTVPSARQLDLVRDWLDHKS